MSALITALLNQGYAQGSGTMHRHYRQGPVEVIDQSDSAAGEYYTVIIHAESEVPPKHQVDITSITEFNQVILFANEGRHPDWEALPSIQVTPKGL